MSLFYRDKYQITGRKIFAAQVMNYRVVFMPLGNFLGFARREA